MMQAFNPVPYLGVPGPAEDFGHQAAQCLNHLTGGRALQARIDQCERHPTNNAWEHDAAGLGWFRVWV